MKYSTKHHKYTPRTLEKYKCKKGRGIRTTNSPNEDSSSFFAYSYHQELGINGYREGLRNLSGLPSLHQTGPCFFLLQICSAPPTVSVFSSLSYFSFFLVCCCSLLVSPPRDALTSLSIPFFFTSTCPHLLSSFLSLQI